ncbi:MAG TPA: hypothetical protein VJI46_01900 [Candidatus Nanoarchaeia archaeon]|nr:hypothetical protein [Candidatus Nanoarchaeia archaeon]
MKVSIDTKEDSVEDIKRVIAMLQNLVGEQAVSSKPSLFESPEPEVSGNVLASIFGAADNNPNPESIQKIQIEDAEKIKVEEDPSKKQFQIEEYY